MYAFPNQRKELLRLAKEDQFELRTYSHAINQITNKELRTVKHDELYLSCHKRAMRMQDIITEIKYPNIRTIGTDGCEAVLILTQHSFLSCMKELLDIFLTQHSRDIDSVPINRLPALIDRIMIFETRKQHYGTQWTVDPSDGSIFLVEIDDWGFVNERRAIFGLKKIKRPVNLADGADKYPLGKGPAKESDQRILADEAYREMTRYAKCLYSKI